MNNDSIEPPVPWIPNRNNSNNNNNNNIDNSMTCRLSPQVKTVCKWNQVGFPRPRPQSKNGRIGFNIFFAYQPAVRDFLCSGLHPSDANFSLFPSHRMSRKIEVHFSISVVINSPWYEVKNIPTSLVELYRTRTHRIARKSFRGNFHFIKKIQPETFFESWTSAFVPTTALSTCTEYGTPHISKPIVFLLSSYVHAHREPHPPTHPPIHPFDRIDVRSSSLGRTNASRQRFPSPPLPPPFSRRRFGAPFARREKVLSLFLLFPPLRPRRKRRPLFPPSSFFSLDRES